MLRVTLRPAIFLGLVCLLLSSCSGGGTAISEPVSIVPSPTQPPPTTSPIRLPIPDPAPQGDDFHPDDKGWMLVWSDEFEGSDLDRNKWEIETSCWGGGNNERQCYTDREENVEVVNGLLWLKAYPETFTGPEFPQGWPGGRGGEITQSYTSGKVRTRELADWTYGRFSARIKLPKGQGTWPAFWMLPSDETYGSWAASGEIDIMEAVNLGADCTNCEGDIGENHTTGSIHFGGEYPANQYITGKRILTTKTSEIDDYHIYSIEWGEGRINWFVDGEKFLTLNQEDWSTSAISKDENSNAPFDQDFFIALNLAVGGTYPEGTNENRFDETSFPTGMTIDWVRVYICDFDGADSRSCMDAE